jgi:misacylated tRNA(Ala) deacylase
MSARPPVTGGRVRLVEIEGIDLQACGGTHVHSTPRSARSRSASSRTRAARTGG